jgi:hypothetical protein
MPCCAFGGNWAPKRKKRPSLFGRLCHEGLEVSGWTEDPEAARNTSIGLARRALRSGPEDPNILALAAFVLGYFGEDIDVAIRLIDRGLTLNPSFARGWHWSGILRVFAGQPRSRARAF